MILYFSGTGNSRFCAEFLARALHDPAVDAFSMLRRHTAAEFSSEVPWVFVAPTYAWQLPHIFADFLKTSRFTGSADAYFVMTCGADIGSAAEKNQELCREIGLCCKGTLAVVMPENYVAMFPVPDECQARTIISNAIPALTAAAETIRARRALPSAAPNVIDKMKSGFVNTAFYSLIVKDKRFTVSSACISCGKCAASCVLSNIRLDNGRPVWGGECTHCMACICGCPTGAIEYGKHSIGKPRYQCPSFTE